VAAGPRIGVGPDDRVAIISLNSDRVVEAFFGCFWAGAVASPLNVRWDPREMAHALNDCGARVLLIDDACLPVTDSLLGAVASLSTVVHLGDGPAPAGLLACARQVYGRLRNGFYGLEVMLVVLVFLALLREARAEGATRIAPAALGRVLGLDRAPEVKTIRRKLAELAAAGKAAELQLALARHHAATRPDALGFLYIDGHTRAYFGKRDIQKMHLARLKFPGPATEETWVTGGGGDPLLVVMAQPSSSLAAQIRDLLPALRDITGPAARPVLCFDRGGWSPDLFADIIDAKNTYKRGHSRRVAAYARALASAWPFILSTGARRCRPLLHAISAARRHRHLAARVAVLRRGSPTPRDRPARQRRASRPSAMPADNPCARASASPARRRRPSHAPRPSSPGP